MPQNQMYPGNGEQSEQGWRLFRTGRYQESLNNQLKTVLLLLLRRFSRVRLCASPWTAAYQASPSMGFSKQKHWSGLPFPSPMHESGKSKWSRSVVSESLRSYGLQPTRLFHPWDFPGKSTGVGCHCLLWLSVIPVHKRKQYYVICPEKFWK